MSGQKLFPGLLTEEPLEKNLQRIWKASFFSQEKNGTIQSIINGKNISLFIKFCNSSVMSWLLRAWEMGQGQKVYTGK